MGTKLLVQTASPLAKGRNINLYCLRGKTTENKINKSPAPGFLFKVSVSVGFAPFLVDVFPCFSLFYDWGCSVQSYEPPCFLASQTPLIVQIGGALLMRLKPQVMRL